MLTVYVDFIRLWCQGSAHRTREWVSSDPHEERGGVHRCSGVNWPDMDFDPGPLIAKVALPVLVFYGDDEWVPVPKSVEISRERFPHPDLLAVSPLSGTGYHPTFGDGRVIESFNHDYTETLISWMPRARHVLGPTNVGPIDPARRCWPYFRSAPTALSRGPR